MARKLLIYTFKILPFFLCFIILLTHTETIFAILSTKIVYYEGLILYDTPISFFIARYIKIDILVIISTTIASFAIESCIWNKLSILYIFSVIIQKYYFESFELNEYVIVIILVTNILISAFLVFKGIRKIK